MGVTTTKSPFFKRAIVISYDAAMIAAVWAFAFMLAFNLRIPKPFYLHQMALFMPFVVAIQLLANTYFGLYRMLWRFSSLPDLTCIIKSCATSTLCICLSMFFLEGHVSFSRSAPILYGILAMLALGGGRLVYRWLRDYRKWFVQGKPVLIVGVEQAGIYLAKELLRDPDKTYMPIGFIDDSDKHARLKIHGLPVLGSTDKLESILESYGVELIFISSTNISADKMRKIVESCNEQKVEFRTLPNLRDIIDGVATMSSYRPVVIEDLLGREQISLSWDEIKSRMHNANVLVTGGGGSIGSELCRQISGLAPANLIVVDSSEYNLFVLENEIRQKLPNLSCHFHLADVCDKAAIEQIFIDNNINIIFHAAAYKHVPMLEEQVRIAVKNNVLGTKQMADLANKYKVDSFVLISTDKAVNPSNIMGCTKRIAEIYCQNLNDKAQHTKYITVRFGNVLGSKGSVVPIFEKQLKAGGPLTVTHPDITRFFMTIPEAVELILQAMSMGVGGEIFVLEMGEPVKINYLAEQFIKLSGRTPYSDIQIVYTGLRKGEKLYEQLFHDGEKVVATEHEKILRSQSRKLGMSQMNEQFSRLIAGVESNDEGSLLGAINALVPEHCMVATSVAVETELLPKKNMGKIVQLNNSDSILDSAN